MLPFSAMIHAPTYKPSDLVENPSTTDSGICKQKTQLFTYEKIIDLNVISFFP